MIYKVILNRMPDENSNPVGTAQTIQNDQASTNESGNDFILDFGESEDVSETQDMEESGLNPLEINNEKIESDESKEESSNLEDHDMNQNDLFGESPENAEQNTDSDSTDLNDDFSLQFENDFSNEEESKEENLDKDIQLENNDISTENVEEKGINLIDESQPDETNIDSQEEISDTNDLFQEINDGAIEDNEKTLQDIQLDIQEEKEEEDSDFQIDLNNDNAVEQNNENMEKDNMLEGGEDSKDFDVEELKEEKTYDLEDETENYNQNENVNTNISEELENPENTDNSSMNPNNDFLLENNNISEREPSENSNYDERNSIDTNYQPEEISNTEENINLNEKDISNKNDFFNEIEENNMVDGGASDGSQDSFNENTQNKEQLDNNIQVDNQIKDESQSQTDYFLGDSDDGITKDSFGNMDNTEALDNSTTIGTEEIQNMGDVSIDKNSLSEDITLESNEGINSQEEIHEEVNIKDESQNILQPDMKNLLGGEDVSFSFDTTEKENSKAENPQEVLESTDDNTKTLLNGNIAENNTQANNPSDNQNLGEEINMNYIPNNVEEHQQNLQNDGKEIDTGVAISEVTHLGTETGDISKQNDESNLGSPNSSGKQEENKVKENITQNPNQEVPNNLESNSSASNQSETGVVKSTLSLDQLLDSELDSNPQFSNNSKSMPKNIQTKSGIFSGKKMAVFTGIFIFLLGGFVISLAFPSFSLEKIMEIVNPVEPEELENPVEPEEREYPVEPEESENPVEPEESENPVEPGVQTRSHGAGTKVETIDDNPEDKDSEDQASTGIEPYPTIIEEPTENPTVKAETLSINDIQSTISSFKSQGETYKNVGEEELNEKVIKYASNIIRLCEEYQAQLDLGEGLDEESFSLFKTKVSGFISKITENLEGPNEVITYTNIDYNEDDEKKELRNYLTDR